MAPNGKNAVVPAADSLKSLQTLSDGPAQPGDSWTVFWGKMQQAGWKLTSEGSRLKEVYIPPTGTQIKNGGEKGIDYFTSEDDVKQFAIDHLGWEGHDDGMEVDNDDVGEDASMTSEISALNRQQMLIREAKNRMAKINGTPVQYGDNWLNVKEKMKHTGWKWDIPAPRINGIPMGDDYVWLLPSAKKPKEGGKFGIDYLLCEMSARQFAVDHFNWCGEFDGIDEKFSSEWWKKHPIPAARQVWPILKNKLAFYHAGGLYRHPDAPKRNPQMNIDVFPDAQAMREYLAKTGIPNVEYADLTDEERILIERWVATAYIPKGLDSNHDETLDVLRYIPSFTDDQAWALLSDKIGWHLVNDATSGEAYYYKPEALGYTYTLFGSHGEDYFLSISEVRDYLRANGPFDARYNYKWARLKDRDQEIPCNVGPQEYIALTFWASMAPLPKHESEAIDAELSSRKETPPLLAQEEKDDSAHKPKVDNEAFLAERPNSSSIAAFSFEELEKVYLEKKRERDDVIAAERLPFEKLEMIYRERKRQRTAIDLTEDNAGAFEHGDTDNALRNMAKQAETYSTKLVAVKKEMEDTKEDLEDANELVQQQTLTVDVWQSRFDELAKEPGLDAQKINEIRNRPLSSGR